MADAHNHQMGMDMDDDGMGMDMVTMTMYFYQSVKVNFLFDGYSTESSVGYFGACMVSIFFGFITETLSIMQDKLDQ